MKVNIKNEEKVKSALFAVEKRASARLMRLKDIKDGIDAIESKLKVLFGVKADWVGLEFDITCPTRVPGSYMGVPYATFVNVRACASGWFITGIERRPATYSGIGLVTNSGDVCSNIAESLSCAILRKSYWSS